MRKQKDVFSTVDCPPVSHPPPRADPKAPTKFRALLREYEHLYEETELRKRKLKTMKQKKATLLAEVRFLRQRFKCLTEDNKHKLNYAHLRPPLSKKHRKERNSIQNGRVYSESKSAFLVSPSQPQASSQLTMHSEDGSLQKSTKLPDLNSERMYSSLEAEASRQNTAPFFDLNQISMEGELWPVGETNGMAEVRKSAMKTKCEARQDAKLTDCLVVRNGLSRSGKKRISWQDQVSLKV